MPRSISMELQSHLAQRVTTLACCWRVEATDGTILGFTDHTEDLTVDAESYAAFSGVQPTTVHARTGLAVDNLDVQAILDSDAITETDLYAGKWDYASVLVFLINYEDLTQGTLVLQKGQIGEVSWQDGQFKAEMRSLLQSCAQQIVALTTPNCRVKQLGDAECGISLPGFTKAGAVTVATSRRVFTVNGAAGSQANSYFQYGRIQFTSGSNSGRYMEVKDNTGGVITLQQPMPFSVAVADTVSIVAGCDRTRAACRDKFNNIVNFRGEPDIPGNDAQQRRATPA